MAPQSQLEESANDRGEAGVGGGTQNQSTSAFSTFEDPSFGGVFLDIAFIIASARQKKKIGTHTHRHHTDLSRSGGRLGPVSSHFKRCNRSKKPSKEGPESSSQIPLTSRLMGTSHRVSDIINVCLLGYSCSIDPPGGVGGCPKTL